MGEKYTQWVADPAVGPLLEAHQISALPLEQANALESLVDLTRATCKEYGITRKAAASAISEVTHLESDALRKFIEDVRDRTIYRFNR